MRTGHRLRVEAADLSGGIAAVDLYTADMASVPVFSNALVVGSIRTSIRSFNVVRLFVYNAAPDDVPVSCACEGARTDGRSTPMSGPI